MGRKPKFKPVITRVKLNPEQAVLSCDCYLHGQRGGSILIASSTPVGLEKLKRGPA